MKKALTLFACFSIMLLFSCKHEPQILPVDPSDNLAIDSIRATKTVIPIWEEIWVTVYARGQNLSYNWSANHGSMSSADSVTIKYWACPSCIGLNTIECKVSNDYGTVTDTIMIRVTY